MWIISWLSKAGTLPSPEGADIAFPSLHDFLVAVLGLAAAIGAKPDPPGEALLGYSRAEILWMRGLCHSGFERAATRELLPDTECDFQQPRSRSRQADSSGKLRRYGQHIAVVFSKQFNGCPYLRGSGR